MPRKIIGFTGPMGSGKSAAAKILFRYGYTRVRFAGPLKQMMACIGLNEREIEGDLKEVPCALLGGKTPRFAMQTIGTEWGRDLIDKQLWINVWTHAVNRLHQYIPVVCDDVRFPNEAAAVRAVGGKIIRVERPGLMTNGSHASERFGFDADYVVANDGSLDDLENTLRGLLWSPEQQAAVDQSWVDNAGIPAA